MNQNSVDTSLPVTLVGGGAATNNDLETALLLAPRLVAADGGLRLALNAKTLPEAVIGDFDSVNVAELRQMPADRQFHVAEQDTTDFEKAVMRIEAPVILAVGFTGARVDHQLAVLNVLVKYPHRPILVLGECEVIFHLPPVLDLPLDADEVVSLFPMGGVTGRSTGLRWPIDGLHFAPGHQIGTSNAATGPVRLEMDNPGMIAFLPRARLELMLRALTALPCAARWPAPAARRKAPPP